VAETGYGSYSLVAKFKWLTVHIPENIAGKEQDRWHIKHSCICKKDMPSMQISSSTASTYLYLITLIISLWSNGQSSWLQTQRSWVRFQHYQIFWEVVGLERGPLSLVGTTEELLERKSSGSGLETWEYSCGDLLCWPDHVTPSSRKTLH
jgi:hypothetical protein